MNFSFSDLASNLNSGHCHSMCSFLHITQFLLASVCSALFPKYFDGGFESPPDFGVYLGFESPSVLGVYLGLSSVFGVKPANVSNCSSKTSSL